MERGGFEPITLGKDEVVLAHIELQCIRRRDQIVLQAQIGWENTWNIDMGEIEIIIRAGGPDGEIVESVQESCFRSTVTRLSIKQSGGPKLQTYVLAVKSEESRSRIIGPYFLKATVTGPEKPRILEYFLNKFSKKRAT